MISKKEREEIIAKLRANPNTNQVAKAVSDVSQGTVWRIAKKAGIELVGTKPLKQDESKREKIIAALLANPNASQVAKAAGDVSQGTVWRIAKKAGIELARTKQSKQRGSKREEIIAALKANPNTHQVAKAVGDVSHVTVWKIARELGINRPRGRPKKAVPSSDNV